MSEPTRERTLRLVRTLPPPSRGQFGHDRTAIIRRRSCSRRRRVDDSGQRHRSWSGPPRREGRFRLLQLWLTLPKADRRTEPDHQLVRSENAPVRREPGAEVRVYSGTTGTLRSTTRNRVPATLVDFRVEPGAEVRQQIRVSYNGFLYVLDGEARIGKAAQRLASGQVGWLARLPSTIPA